MFSIKNVTNVTVKQTDYLIHEETGISVLEVFHSNIISK